MKITSLDLNRCIWKNLAPSFSVPRTEWGNHFLLLKVFDRDINNPIGFLGRIPPESLRQLLPHENILPRKVEIKSQIFRNKNIAVKPVFAIFKESGGIIEHLRDGYNNGVHISSYEKDGLLYELRSADSAGWGDQLISLFEQVPHMIIGDGHHRTAAYRKLLEEGHDSKGLFTAFFSHEQIAIFSFERRVRIADDIIVEELWSCIEEYCNIKWIDSIPRQLKPGAFICVDREGIRELLWKDSSVHFGTTVETLDVYLFHKLILAINPSKRQKSWKKISIDFVPHLNNEQIYFNTFKEEYREFVFVFPPVSSEFLVEESAKGKVMPPKTTWIEPKMTSKIINVPI